eukprot:XP_011521811.1 uncharacterized protein LOC105371371 [Homo sapiens]
MRQTAQPGLLSPSSPVTTSGGCPLGEGQPQCVHSSPAKLVTSVTSAAPGPFVVSIGLCLSQAFEEQLSNSVTDNHLTVYTFKTTGKPQTRHRGMGKWRPRGCCRGNMQCRQEVPATLTSSELFSTRNQPQPQPQPLLADAPVPWAVASRMCLTPGQGCGHQGQDEGEEGEASPQAQNFRGSKALPSPEYILCPCSVLTHQNS